MIHKKIRNQRVQNAYTDGKITIVQKEVNKDEFGTPIPGDPILKELGSYFFRIQGIHSRDRIEFGNAGINVEKEVVIPLNYHINSGMTAYLGDDSTALFNIVKVYQDVPNNELEILLAREGGQYNTQTENQQLLEDIRL